MSRYEYAVFVRKGQELKMVGIGPVEDLKELDSDYYDFQRDLEFNLIDVDEVLYMKREIGEWTKVE